MCSVKARGQLKILRLASHACWHDEPHSEFASGKDRLRCKP